VVRNRSSASSPRISPQTRSASCRFVRSLPAFRMSTFRSSYLFGEFDVAIPDLNDVAVQVNCEIACYENRPMLERFSKVAPRGSARATVRAGTRRRDIERFLPASNFSIAGKNNGPGRRSKVTASIAPLDASIFRIDTVLTFDSVKSAWGHRKALLIASDTPGPMVAGG